LQYAKPHLSFEAQLAKLTARGLACDDGSRTLQVLRSVGYYRLSAYVYPFRDLLPPEEQTAVHYRSDTIREGVSWKHVEDLWAFDRALRLLCLDAAEVIEVGMRTQVAYVLGARDPFGHMNRQSLDPAMCDRPVGNRTAFEVWSERYKELKDAAKSEDYVKHHLVTYRDSEVPIWVAVEFLSFGAVTRLFSLMRVEDQNDVARAVGVSSGGKLHAFLLTAGYVRNLSAHHSRLWNRRLAVTLPKFHETEVGPDMRHLAGAPLAPKIYGALAMMAYLVRNISPQADWSRRLRERVAKFPAVPYLSAEIDMGFPVGWATLRLWHDPPRGIGFSLPTRRR